MIISPLASTRLRTPIGRQSPITKEDPQSPTAMGSLPSLGATQAASLADIDNDWALMSYRDGDEAKESLYDGVGAIDLSYESGS